MISTQVKRLIAPERFPAKMAEFKREHLGPCRLSGPLFGTERFALEHWVHSHPRCSPCDASASAKFQFVGARRPRRGDFDRVSRRRRRGLARRMHPAARR